MRGPKTVVDAVLVIAVSRCIAFVEGSSDSENRIVEHRTMDYSKI
jgi:hypothetical protein